MSRIFVRQGPTLFMVYILFTFRVSQVVSAGRMKYLTLTDPKKVWMPDTFFRNEKTGHFHNILVNNVYIR